MVETHGDLSVFVIIAFVVKIALILKVWKFEELDRLGPWQPTPKDRQFAVEHGCEPDATLECFCDYWHAATGARAVKRDWSATWRMWVRRSNERPSAPNGHAKLSPVEKLYLGAQRAAYAVAERERAREQAAKPLLDGG
jgi:hypothetical protein